MKNVIDYNSLNRCSIWKQLELNVLCKELAIILDKNTSYRINSDV